MRPGAVAVAERMSRRQLRVVSTWVRQLTDMRAGCTADVSARLSDRVIWCVFRCLNVCCRPPQVMLNSQGPSLCMPPTWPELGLMAVSLTWCTLSYLTLFWVGLEQQKCEISRGQTTHFQRVENKEASPKTLRSIPQDALQ